MLLILCDVSGCIPRSAACLLPDQQPTTVTELFFGRNIPGRAPLTESEWSEFAASVIAKEFPDGFTVLDGSGAWRDPATNAIMDERTKVVVVAAAEDDLATRIERVTSAYKRAYAQRSVGELSYATCGTFEN